MILNLLLPSTLLLALTITLVLLFRVNNRKKIIENELSACQETLNHFSRISDSILSISHAVVGTETPEDLYKLILEKAIQTIPNANVGSVFGFADDGRLHCLCQQGYDEEKIKKFSLALEDTILWKFTGGNISKTEIINDVASIPDLTIKPLAVDESQWTINSSLVVPIFSGHEIIGLLHIDSKEKEAFTYEDWISMEYIRSNIEVALQKFFLYSKTVTLSRYDSLTNAYNRSYFFELFERLINKSERYERIFALIVADIDDLKNINDSMGHLTGDRVLKAFSSTVLKIIRKTDLFTRWGGDEFIIILDNIDESGISEKIQEIRDDLNEHPILCGEKQITVSFSSGYSAYPSDGSSFDELMKRADQKMYEEKRQRKKAD